jgi:hypothetical protein
VLHEEDRTADSERALAALRLVERLGHRLPKKQLCAEIELTGLLLESSHDLSVIRRIARINRQALLWTNSCPGRPDWSKFNLREVQLRNECHYVEQALADANGSVTKAAELLGLASHQSLLYMLNGRLKNRVRRPPAKPRKRASSNRTKKL